MDAVRQPVQEIVSAQTLPSTQWNLRQVRENRLLNTQYGVLSHTSIARGAREVVRTTHGTVEAIRYTYTGDLQAIQWFDDKGRWVKAAFTAFDGSSIEYILQD